MEQKFTSKCTTCGDVKEIEGPWNETVAYCDQCAKVTDAITGEKIEAKPRKYDAHGNRILAQMNGWTITAGEFCYMLSKGKKVATYKGTLDGAKWFAAHDCQY